MIEQRWQVARSARGWFGSAVVACALLACGTDEADENDAGPGGGSGADAGGSSADAGVMPVARKSNAGLFGDFKLKFDPETEATPLAAAKPAVSSVLGIFSDRATPPKTRLAQQAEIGDCKLFTPDVPLCETECAAMDAKCTDDDVCTPNPKAQDVGIMHFTAGPNALDLKFVVKSYQLAAKVTLPYPACAEGETVRIEAEGGAYEPFAIETPCIDLLQVGGPFAIERGKPLALSWSAPGDPELARMKIRLDVSHHGGGSKGEIQCDVADTGAFDIPAELMDALVDLGFAGFPTVTFTRESVAHPDGEPANATLSVAMPQEREVTIAGLMSCASDNSQCPTGQICQPDLTCK